jgi:hypothetical protein
VVLADGESVFERISVGVSVAFRDREAVHSMESLAVRDKVGILDSDFEFELDSESVSESDTVELSICDGDSENEVLGVRVGVLLSDTSPEMDLETVAEG